MKSIISVQNRISFCLAACAVTAIATCVQLNLIPDWRLETISHRAQLSETLAGELSLGPIADGPTVAQKHLELFQRRQSSVQSIGLRKSQGDLFAKSGIHETHWSQSSNRVGGQFVVPIVKANEFWGHLEISYEPLHTWNWLAYFPSWFMPSLLLGGIIFIVSRFLLKRVLQHLDPSQVVPSRVKETLDTFAEGVMLLDDHGRIVLANDALTKGLGVQPEQLIGQVASEFDWDLPKEGKTTLLPWQEVARSRLPIHSAQVRLNSEISPQYFSVNTVPVFDDSGHYRGAMTAFADVTALEEKKRALALAVEELQVSRDDIATKNQELELLATRDPLTNCLNRRSLFERFEAVWHQAKQEDTSLACIMIDIDFFKSINDNYGHSVGDEVLRVTGNTLLAQARKADLPARYGGEEFCLVLPGTNLEDAFRISEHIRGALADLQFEGFAITASLGISSTELAPQDPQGLIDQADKCLYVAKRQGRNQSVRFDQIDSTVEIDESTISRVKPSEQEPQNSNNAEIPYRSATALLATLAYRDPETAEHSMRVADLAVVMGRHFMGPKETYRLEIAALLHDIGKIGVPDSILLKPGPLSAPEWAIMRMHDRYGVEIVKAAFGVESLTEIVRHHHTRYDNADLESLPLSARIVSIVDAYDAMVNDRPYRKGMDTESAIRELNRCAGQQFDPELVNLFCNQVLPELQYPSKNTSRISQETALCLGRQIEGLTDALENEDVTAVAALSSRLANTAKQCGVTNISIAAKELSDAAIADEEATTLAALLHELMSLNSSMHASVLKSVANSKSFCSSN